jgi:hypothetical protein
LLADLEEQGLGVKVLGGLQHLRNELAERRGVDRGDFDHAGVVGAGVGGREPVDGAGALTDAHPPLGEPGFELGDEPARGIMNRDGIRPWGVAERELAGHMDDIAAQGPVQRDRTRGAVTRGRGSVDKAEVGSLGTSFDCAVAVQLKTGADHQVHDVVLEDERRDFGAVVVFEIVPGPA